jgi:hypothetical protein
LPWWCWRPPPMLDFLKPPQAFTLGKNFGPENYPEGVDDLPPATLVYPETFRRINPGNPPGVFPRVLYLSSTGVSVR